MIANTISGFPTGTKKEKIAAAGALAPSSERSSLAPRAMKKNSSRKSRNGARRVAIVSR